MTLVALGNLGKKKLMIIAGANRIPILKQKRVKRIKNEYTTRIKDYEDV
tara:strand:+ start:140 stop:286 length:147 start_codon:yes stop_codon:yes gene_type:complete